MKKIIVLEGADSSGKTTLAKAIGAPNYFHGLPYIGWVEGAHRAMLAAALRCAARGELAVIDRHWVSEMIYGPAFRGRAAYGDDVAREFDEVIRGFGLYVLCVPGDAAKHERRFQRERAEKAELFPTMSSVIERYRLFAEGYMHEVSEGYLARFVRHGDFALLDCVVYDLDEDGRDLPKFVEKVMRRLG